MGFHNFVEIVREKEYSFSKCLLALLPPIEGRYEGGGENQILPKKDTFCGSRKNFSGG
jgi:hypothetical protein